MTQLPGWGEYTPIFPYSWLHREDKTHVVNGLINEHLTKKQVKFIRDLYRLHGADMRYMTRKFHMPADVIERIAKDRRIVGERIALWDKDWIKTHKRGT